MSANPIAAFLHDVKNKLSNIKFSISMLLQRDEKIDTQTRKKLLKNILISAESTIDIIQEYFEIDRYKKLKYLPKSTFRLRELLEEIFGEFSPEIESKKLEIQIFEDEPIILIHNREWLKKALTNILHNAIKYNHEYGFIRVELKQKGSKAEIVVHNSTKEELGPQELDKIFHKYATSQQEDSTGIGLSLTKAIISSFGGTIEAQSEKGSVIFVIEIPRVAHEVRVKRLIKAVAAFSIALLVGVGYFVPLIPQHVSKTDQNGVAVYNLECGVNIVANLNDDLKVKAYKNLFGNIFDTSIHLVRGDAKVKTNGAKVTFFARNLNIKNIGTEFDSRVEERNIAVSVFDGVIMADHKRVVQKTGIVKRDGKVKVRFLPKKVSKFYWSKNLVTWESPYSMFKVLISEDRDLTKVIYSEELDKRRFELPQLPDKQLFLALFSIDDGLLSLPRVESFLSLQNYEKALQFYEMHNIRLAKKYLYRSLQTIGNDSYKPYLLFARILMNEKKYKEALKPIQKAYALAPKEAVDSYIEILSYNGLDSKILALKNYDISKSGYFVANAYYTTGQKEKAKEILWEYLLIYPKDQKALDLLQEITKNNAFIQQQLEEIR